MMQKPFKTYLGGKESSGVYQTIINHIPKHKTLIIPFLGNCAITRYIKRSDNTILIDADPRVIKKWCTIFTNDVPDQHNIIDDSCSSITLINDDSISYLQKCSCDQETVIYADPPYLKYTRTSRSTKYEYDLTFDDHTSLLTVLRSMDCNILISCYDNDLYKTTLFGWNKTNFKSQTRSGSRIETLYYNFNLNDIELHDYSYLGKNFRERERIKKKINRHYARLKQLPRFEALAIMNKLTSAVTTKTVIPDLSSNLKIAAAFK